MRSVPELVGRRILISDWIYAESRVRPALARQSKPNGSPKPYPTLLRRTKPSIVGSRIVGTAAPTPPPSAYDCKTHVSRNSSLRTYSAPVDPRFQAQLAPCRN